MSKIKIASVTAGLAFLVIGVIVVVKSIGGPDVWLPVGGVLVAVFGVILLFVSKGMDLGAK